MGDDFDRMGKMGIGGPPIVKVEAYPGQKPKVTLHHEPSDEEEYGLICFGIIRALMRWPETWQEEIGKIAHAELECMNANGGEFPAAEDEL